MCAADAGPSAHAASMLDMSSAVGSIGACNNGSDVPWIKGSQKTIQQSQPGTSLGVQWLRLHIPSAGARVRFLFRELDLACDVKHAYSPALAGELFIAGTTWKAQNTFILKG